MSATNNAVHDMITVDQLKEWLADGNELALLDIREHGEYGEGHLFFATSIPYSQLERRIRQLVPRLNTRIILYDENGGGLARKAAQRLDDLRYSAVHILTGGVNAWKHAGHNVFAGVNVPSKAFGELVEHHCHTPRITARELADLQAADADLVVLDGRPVPEYEKMSIPAAICCPNGELALRASEIVGNPDTMIVVNCAGRTRSIVGAQTLIDMGTPNRVRALENGTQGWYLADLPLEHNAGRFYPVELPDVDLAAKQQNAACFAKKNNVPVVTTEDLKAWSAQPGRTTFLCDIRTPEEFAQGTLNGAIHAPGGQLIQGTDLYLGTRNARVVVFDAECVRAIYVAVWLKRMGWEVYVLGDAAAHLTSRSVPDDRESGAPVRTPLTEIDAGALLSRVGQGDAVLDMRSSMQYRKSHLKGAQWAIRPRLAELGLGHGTTVTLIVDHPMVAEMVAKDLAELGAKATAYFRWNENRLDALPLEQSPESPPDDQCIDYLFFVHDRHDGNKEAARQYLSWELGLLEQLDATELAGISKHL